MKCPLYSCLLIARLPSRSRNIWCLETIYRLGVILYCMCMHPLSVVLLTTDWIISYSFPPQILPEADHPRTVEGQSREKRKRLTKSAAGCPFYKPGPLENFRDLALVHSSTNLHRWQIWHQSCLSQNMKMKVGHHEYKECKDLVSSSN